MSNDQPQNTPQLLPPVLLVVSVTTPQQQKAKQFIQEQLGWRDVSDVQLSYLNTEGDSLTIEQVRQLISELAYAGHLGKKRAFILLHADLITSPAQHALLKSLEEPPSKTQLILVSSQPEKLLPTIHSRCITQYWTSETTQPISEVDLPPVINQLLTDTKPSISELITVTGEHKDRDAAITLIQNMILYLHPTIERTQKPTYIAVQQQLLQTLAQLRANVNTRLALEHCFFEIKKLV